MEEKIPRKARQPDPDAIGKTVIISLMVVSMTCILACTGIAITYILSAY